MSDIEPIDAPLLRCFGGGPADGEWMPAPDGMVMLFAEVRCKTPAIYVRNGNRFEFEGWATPWRDNQAERTEARRQCLAARRARWQRLVVVLVGVGVLLCV